MENNTKYITENGHDKCVCCGTETEYTSNTNINLREFYIEGSGQLCEDCYYDIYSNID